MDPAFGWRLGVLAVGARDWVRDRVRGSYRRVPKRPLRARGEMGQSLLETRQGLIGRYVRPDSRALTCQLDASGQICGRTTRQSAEPLARLVRVAGLKVMSRPGRLQLQARVGAFRV